MKRDLKTRYKHFEIHYDADWEYFTLIRESLEKVISELQTGLGDPSTISDHEINGRKHFVTFKVQGDHFSWLEKFIILDPL